MGRFSQDRIRSIAAHGAEKHTNITRTIWLPAIKYGAGVFTATESGTFPVAQGAAAADAPYLELSLKVPDDFVSFTKMELLWDSPAAAGNMYWKMNANYAAAGEAENTHTDTPAYGVTATAGANLLNLQQAPNPLTLTNLAAGDYIGFWAYRVGSNALDTLGAVANFYGILFTYVANQ